LQPVVIAIFNIILLLIIGKWKPYFCFYKKRFKEMFAYSSNLLLSYIINRIGENIYSVIIGKSFSSSSLGFYNQAHKMQTVPSEAIRSIIMTASYPIIANEKNPNKRYDLYLSVFSKFTFIVSAMVFLLMAVSDFAFYALLGEKWIPAAPLFSIFILITLTFPQKVVNANIIKIQGDSALYRNLSLLDTVLRIIALLVTMTYSLEMIVVGQVVAAFISAYTYTACCGKRIGFSTKKQYRIWYSIVWKPLAAFFVSKVILSFFKMGYWGDMFSAVFFLVVLCSLCELTKDHTYINLKTIYITYLKKLCK
jgi:O-antigen repeat unit transporter